ncbi:DUF2800 domain-containing protein [Mesorhizobium sp. M0139]|uniref:DUF2800 domain-containing protein n=1 Tax=Mesorhizobium sp. M0139 TaxID=2956892 RepID=UPI00333C4326
MSETHTARKHAKLAPSAAKRWINCAGSVRATDGLPDETSSAAAEGTAAHELCSHCLTTGDDPAAFLDMYVDIHAAEGKPRFVSLSEEPTGENAMRFFPVDDEMVDAVEMYVSFVRGLLAQEPDAEMEVEQRLDMTHLHPAIFGTGDATVFLPIEAHLHVPDFKYGKGIAVDADENPQLLLYAAGAARRYHNRKIAKLTAHIIQPRAPHRKGPIRSYDIDLLDLFEFEDMLAAAAAATDDPNAPFCAGSWCHDSFCKIEGTCPTNRVKRLADAGAEFGDVETEAKFPAIDTMTVEQRSAVLREADGLLSYVKAVQEAEHAKALAGNGLPDFKLVAKRAVRKWKDEKAAKNHLYDLGATNDDIMTEPKFRSPAQLEKLFPGKNATLRQAAMADLVVKQSSGLNLVPASDPRPAVKVDAASEFEVVE